MNKDGVAVAQRTADLFTLIFNIKGGNRLAILLPRSDRRVRDLRLCAGLVARN